LLGKTVVIETASNIAGYTTGFMTNAAELPAPLVIMLSILVGSSVGAAGTKLAFKNGAEEVLGQVDNNIGKILDVETPENVIIKELGETKKAPKGGTETLSSEDAEEYAFQAIKGPDNAESIMLGKYEKGSLNSYDEMAKAYNSQFFNLDNWDELSRNYSRKEIWKINEKYLDIQTSSGREIYLSHNPVEYVGDGSYYSSEIQYLIDNGYRFLKEGDVWHAVR
ncbi:MAG TPA: hypothetical protein VIL99_14055, partial [Ignavibacteria bacterium]